MRVPSSMRLRIRFSGRVKKKLKRRPNVPIVGNRSSYFFIKPIGQVLYALSLEKRPGIIYLVLDTDGRTTAHDRCMTWSLVFRLYPARALWLATSGYGGYRG